MKYVIIGKDNSEEQKPHFFARSVLVDVASNDEFIVYSDFLLKDINKLPNNAVFDSDEFNPDELIGNIINYYYGAGSRKKSIGFSYIYYQELDKNN